MFRQENKALPSIMLTNVGSEKINDNTKETTISDKIQGEEKLCRVVWQVELL